MSIKSIHIRRLRSLASTQLLNCGNLNVLIGKNNAGKSNILYAIDLVNNHLSSGLASRKWVVQRQNDEFFARDSTNRIQIGVEFDLYDDLSEGLRLKLLDEYAHLEKSIDQIEDSKSISFVISISRRSGQSFMFVEQISVGHVIPGEILRTEGIRLFHINEDAAYELFRIQEEAENLQNDLKVIARAESREFDFVFENKDRSRYMYDRMFGDELRTVAAREIQSMMLEATSADDFRTRVKSKIVEMKDLVDQLDSREISNPISAFAGDAKTLPGYASWLMRSFGSDQLLHLREAKAPIGREEAEALLSLKVTRGGPERLATVQRTVRSLLGVEVDAFQAEASRGVVRSAEMDIDQFLVEANGAGVREALRLILDLELKKPNLALIEEPEVHLHPGLEHAVYDYLRDKSSDIQMFVTTHSTSFVDSVSFQNTYLVSRDVHGKTQSVAVDEGEGPLKIPAELGLRLSTVFMYDRLVFVEGPSDEAVLRELSKLIGADMPKRNVAFVQMGGVSNFAHYAAEGTLDLLSRRNINMWFITDRDERDDVEVRKMIERLGDKAKLHVLRRREIENYLLDAQASYSLILEKRREAGVEGADLSVREVEDALLASAEALRSEVERLRTDKIFLKPVYLQRRGVEGDTEARLRAGIAELEARISTLPDAKAKVSEELDREWKARLLELVPGALILDECYKSFGVRFHKDSGDSARLARLIGPSAIPDDLKSVLKEIVAM